MISVLSFLFVLSYSFAQDVKVNGGSVGASTSGALEITPTLSLGSFPSILVDAIDNSAVNGYGFFVSGNVTPSVSNMSRHTQISTGNADSRFTLKCGDPTDFAPRLQMISGDDIAGVSRGSAIFDYGSFNYDNSATGFFAMRFMAQGGPPIEMIRASGADGVYLVHNGGLVGVGTNSPQELLHVAGTIRSDVLTGVTTQNVGADADGNLVIYPISGTGGSGCWTTDADSCYSGNFVGVGVLPGGTPLAGLAQFYAVAASPDTAQDIGRYGLIGYTEFERADGAGAAGVFQAPTVVDGAGVAGFANRFDGWGFGVSGTGGYVGTAGYCFPVNTFGGAQQAYGLIGIVTGGDTNAVGSLNIGVYGEADGAEMNWAGYFVGDVFASEQYLISDRRMKKNIRPLKDGLETIMQLEGHSYEFKEGNPFHQSSGTHYGFVAQEVEKVIPEAVLDASHVDGPIREDGKVIRDEEAIPIKAVNYQSLLPFMVEAIKEQQAMISMQQEEISLLREEIRVLKGEKGSDSPSIDDARLFQNVPNPTDGQTWIPYFLAEGSVGEIQIVNTSSGVVVERIGLKGAGHGQVDVNMEAYSGGVYVYQLVVGGEIVGSKKLVLQ